MRPNSLCLVREAIASVRVAALPAAMLLFVAVPLCAQDPEPPEGASECRVFGRVLDADTGAPIGGASVWLERTAQAGEGLQAARAAGEDGAYLIDFIPCHAYVLKVSMLGYEATHTEVLMEGVGAYEATIRLTRAPIQLDTLSVSVPLSTLLQDAGFYARKAWVASTGEDLAAFYDPVEVKGRSRAYHSVPTLVESSRIRFLYGRGGLLCHRPSVYIDGRRYQRSLNFYEFLDMRVSTEDVEGIEIYRPMSTAIPLEYRDEDSPSCGLILIWTKNGPRPR